MKKSVLLLLMLSCILACSKPTKVNTDVKDNCPERYVAISPDRADFRDFWTFEVDSNKSMPYAHFVVSGYITGGAAYDRGQKQYYVVSKHLHDSTQLVQYNFAKNEKSHYKNSGSVLSGSETARLLCNNATKKLYCICWPSDTSKAVQTILELVLANDRTSERVIYTTDLKSHIISPVIDEQSGCIYFIKAGELIKLDPTSNTASVLTTLNDIRPYEFVYSLSDGMFYGIDAGIYPNNFVRIDPGNGHATRLAPMPYIDTTAGATGVFDKCRGCYVAICPSDYGSDQAFYYVDIKTGRTIKEGHKKTNGLFYVLTSVNN